jgi:hypothetical protein
MSQQFVGHHFDAEFAAGDGKQSLLFFLAEKIKALVLAAIYLCRFGSFVQFLQSVRRVVKR